jgi:hypothetical protein
VWLLFEVRTPVFMTAQLFQKQPKLSSRKHLVAGLRVCQTTETVAMSVLLGFKKSFNVVHNWHPLCNKRIN